MNAKAPKVPAQIGQVSMSPWLSGLQRCLVCEGSLVRFPVPPTHFNRFGTSLKVTTYVDKAPFTLQAEPRSLPTLYVLSEFGREGALRWRLGTIAISEFTGALNNDKGVNFTCKNLILTLF